MIEHLIDGVIFVLDKLGYFGTFMGMALESACIPIPSEAILPFGGYLAYTGRLNLFWMIMMGTLGGTVGSIGAYYLGKVGGRPLVEKYADKLRLSKSHLEKSDEYFNKYGEKIVFYSRLLPIIRTFISLPAGISKMDFKKFTIYTFLGSLIWSVLLGYAGYKMGENWTAMRPWFHVADILFVVFVVGFIIYKFVRKKNENVNA
ncbi:DedA family protein [Clostridium magnum]|uniref:TVP38/TMEM64 family inner membrane protein YdjZ n=1 Tax=Clostridium magnum DSM 2767 TaxID=1121326 RepID=A0A162RJU3_9CLOT|nr:DedA family protein [Clostridium magnum]KZL90017.1 TVP38/TMEM64 family inner membrane protein YdjZ [Clostridium magnum DSM 2767]SHI87672.1 membrane protein DedA, SNARE-associated domain [Clostridium magnum DSM 2767]